MMMIPRRRSSSKPATTTSWSPPYADRHLPNRIAAELPIALYHIERHDPVVTPYAQLLRHHVLGEISPTTTAVRVLQYHTPSPAPDPQIPYPPGRRKSITRRISTTPFKVLDAPALQDDFYLNLVDWSPNNILVVGLGSCVYLWSASTSKVTKLCDVADENNTITSVCWAARSSYLAIGTRSGDIHLYDTAKQIKIRNMIGHSMRVGTLSWSGYSLASGSRDRSIILRDYRASDVFTSKLQGHKQEVCGLKWSFDETHLASGGNDNKLLIWSAASPNPIARFADHNAAVKALAWSPHQHGLLASGGGTADRCIRFWNTSTCTAMNSVDTGSQVCNLMWSKTVNEIVSTHGYSLNQIIVWQYPTMTKLATLIGHTYRVLYLAMSPDGQTIVTGAGDETLRFWNAFPSNGDQLKSGSRLGASPEIFPVSFSIR